ncbi:MAG: hypothetical protein QOD09_4722 [Bradyrhizobium sp.]|jgi:hypothetical protein|nr:hypothetical protein [Bradyrhizobium sp.]MEA2950710.1 hypothetical protein [Alphaproteobacteria bacterium]
MTVIWAFDTLGYAKRLQEAGVPNPQAEGHAEAAREFIMIELVTKQDLQAGIEPLRGAIKALEAKIDTVEARLEAKIDTQTLRLTVRLGGIVAAGIGILALLGRIH